MPLKGRDCVVVELRIPGTRSAAITDALMEVPKNRSRRELDAFSAPRAAIPIVPPVLLI